MPNAKTVKVNTAAAKKAFAKKRKSSRGRVPTTLREVPSVRSLNKVDLKKSFLEGMMSLGTITAACKYAGFSATLYYYWTDPHYGEGKHYDEDFVHEVAMAKAAWRDVLRDEATRRAVEGVEKPVFGSKGRGEGSGVIGHVQEYSDRLMEVLLKLNLPEAKEAREGGATVNVDARQVHQTTVNFDPSAMTQVQRDKMRSFLDSMEEEPEAIEHKP